MFIIKMALVEKKIGQNIHFKKLFLITWVLGSDPKRFRGI
jgi:hypothetical protein